MAINNILGSIAFVPREDYSASATYNFLNFVKQNNHWYLCIVRGGITNLPPAATFVDNTQWAAFVESGDNNLLEISKDADTGIVSIVRKGLSNFTFDQGHSISKNGGTALSQRKGLDVISSADIDVSIKDVNEIKIDFTAFELKVTNIKTDADASKAITDFIDVSQDVDLDTMEAELQAILDALGHSDVGVTTQVLTVPVTTGNVETANFTRNDVTVNATTGIITAGTNWAYAGGGDLYQQPQLAYHKQTATINSNNFLVVTIGIAASIKNHASLIKVLEDFIAYVAKPGEANTPDPKATFLENASKQQFSAASNHLDGSTEGITVIAQPAPGSYTKLFTVSIGILASFDSHYDSEAKFFIQNDRGIRGFVQHTGTDTVITAELKAAIEANRAAIDVNKDTLDEYPSITDIQNADDGQIQSVSFTNVAGNKSAMTFTIAKNGTGSDALLMAVAYPDHSPLSRFPGMVIPITITAEDTPTTIAGKLVTSFEGSSNAAIVKFRDGYTGTDGFAYGGYVMTSDGAVVTVTSDNDGKVYNASVSLYQQTGAFGDFNFTTLSHGSGGPTKKFVITDLPTTSPPFIADTAALATLRGSGYVTGQQFIISGAGVLAPNAAPIAAQVVVTYPATGTNVDYKVITGMISETDTDFMEQDLASDPSNFPLRLFIGSFDALATAVSDQTATEVRVRVSTTDTNGSARATSAAAQLNAFNGVTRLTAAGITTGAAYSLNCTVVADGANLIITSNTAGARTTLVDAETGGTTTMTLRQGADATNETLVQNSLYIVLNPTTLINLSTPGQVTVL